MAVGVSSVHLDQNHQQEDAIDDDWCEDGSDALELERELRTKESEFHKMGYSDGVIAGKEAAAQEGFNAGYKQAVLSGYNWGMCTGWSSNFSEAKKGPSRFTFQHMWCSHESFLKDSAAAWRMAPTSSYPMLNVVYKLKHMKGFYRKWNKETFGNVTLNVQEAEASFAHAQKAYDEDASQDNYNTFLLAKDKLEHVLSQ